MEPETFGEKVARLRKAKQMTQANLAQIMQVTDDAVSNWESDVAYPEITSLPLLAKSLGVTADELLSKTTKAKKAFQPRKFIAAFLTVLMVLLSAFEILLSRLNHDYWTNDCIQLLILGGLVWSFQKRDWIESGRDFAYKIFIILVGLILCFGMMWDGANDITYVIPGVSLAMFGARLLCLPVSKKDQQKQERDGD
ncbi:MAG TPA: helix-turn-helix transcriptional regulator [Clostridia bacterium]|nr:helix-turn-helix transcriptional regulator [Clostridia bacterium]